jgi:hypothetical protein
MDFYGWLWGWLWQVQAVRLGLVYLAQSPRSPAWLTNGIWRYTPFGYALRKAFLDMGHLEMARECSEILERHSRRGLGRAVSGPR